MNPNNYCTREAAQGLHEAGIVLKTDFYYKEFDGEVSVVTKETMYQWIQEVSKGYAGKGAIFTTAPMFTEVWRELPPYLDIVQLGRKTPLIYLCGKDTVAGYGLEVIGRQVSANPTDALIDLLIWAEKEAKDAN